jgi:hypothetical protein
MSAVENRRVEYRSLFSPGASSAAKLACCKNQIKITNGYSCHRRTRGTRMLKEAIPTKILVAEHLKPFIWVSEDVFTDLNLGPSTMFELPVGA